MINLSELEIEEVPVPEQRTRTSKPNPLLASVERIHTNGTSAKTRALSTVRDGESPSDIERAKTQIRRAGKQLGVGIRIDTIVVPGSGGTQAQLQYWTTEHPRGYTRSNEDTTAPEQSPVVEESGRRRR